MDENSCNSSKSSCWKNPNNHLGKCKVCEAKATGFHYGINSCEPCKGFFRRTLLRKVPYTCIKSEKCRIANGVRNPCPKCRYEKCLSVGMSINAIKIGRYTYEKRTMDLIELNTKRELEQNGKKLRGNSQVPIHFAKQGIQPPQTRQGIPTSSALNLVSEPQTSRVHPSPTDLTKDPQQNVTTPSDLPQMGHPFTGHTQNDSGTPHETIDETMSDLPQLMHLLDTPEDLSSTYRATSSPEFAKAESILLEYLKCKNAENRLLPGTLMHNLCIVNGCLIPDFAEYSPEKLTAMRMDIATVERAQEKAFLKTPSDTVDVFNFIEVFKNVKFSDDIDFADVGFEEFVNMYKNTGTAVDDRLNIMGKWFHFLEVAVRRFVVFAKMLPGFQDLDLQDQASLIKYGIIEVWLVARSKDFHAGLNAYVAKDQAETFTFDLRKVLGAEARNKMLEAAVQVQEMDLSDQQVLLFKSLMIFFTDRYETKNPGLILQLQDKYMELFLYSVHEKFRNNRTFLLKLGSLLSDLKEAGVLYRKDYDRRAVILRQRDMVTPRFLCEIFCSNPVAIECKTLGSTYAYQKSS